ncbi:MAG: aminotransferase class I/II-fold pyridoxal phosphate-dependent enzyme, partial [Candidatus Eiseniibacteriota bacterium]
LPGISCRKPRGAFYVFPNVKELGRTSQQIADHLLYEAGVASLPGTSFGPGGEGYLRFSYANSTENIRKALARMSDSLAALSS